LRTAWLKKLEIPLPGDSAATSIHTGWYNREMACVYSSAASGRARWSTAISGGKDESKGAKDLVLSRSMGQNIEKCSKVLANQTRCFMVCFWIMIQARHR
jgi:hypothetical protein